MLSFLLKYTQEQRQIYTSKHMKEKQAIYVVQLEIESTSAGKPEAALLFMNQHQYKHFFHCFSLPLAALFLTLCFSQAFCSLLRTKKDQILL